MNAVINDWENLVMEEDKTVKTEGETDIAAAERGGGSRLN